MSNSGYMSRPLFDKGNYYKQLNFFEEQEANFTQIAYFKEFFKEQPEALIPLEPDYLEYEVVLEKNEDSVALAPYLHLEVISEHPENIKLSLIAPDDSEASIYLPSGLAHFNGVIGREYLPGAFADLTNKNLEGAWKIRLSDNAATGDAYYISATLFWPELSCEIKCNKKECGDDGCGGNCGICQDNKHCSDIGECLLFEEQCKGDSCEGAVEIPVESASYKGSTYYCNFNVNGTCGGGLSPDAVYTFKLSKPSMFAAEVKGFDTILYLYKDSCTGEEIACNNNDRDIENGGSKIVIDGMLDAGRYYLVVDGNDLANLFGDYELSVKMCMPDCDGRECGSDSCTGDCGECKSGLACTPDGQCCEPDCDDKSCGDNGCGGLCGECPRGMACDQGNCVRDCEPDCSLLIPCESGKQECSGDLLLECSNTGKEWNLVQRCLSSCVNGTCYSDIDDDDPFADGDSGLLLEGAGSGCKKVVDNSSLFSLVFLLAMIFTFYLAKKRHIKYNEHK